LRLQIHHVMEMFGQWGYIENFHSPDHMGY
jgi:hypothetical protein